MLTKMTAFLARAPALQGLSLTVGDVGPAPYTAGLWCRGITVLDRRENLLGRVTQRCRAEFTLRLCLPRTDADNAARLLDLQTWAAAESAAGRGPVLGNAGREVLRAEQGRMERADAGGTAVYTVRLQAEYTQVYTEETPSKLNPRTGPTTSPPRLAAATPATPAWAAIWRNTPPS